MAPGIACRLAPVGGGPPRPPWQRAAGRRADALSAPCAQVPRLARRGRAVERCAGAPGCRLFP